MEEELFALKWNNHQSTFLRIIRSLRCKNLYADATLACNGKFFSVHRFVLSTCSDYFGDIFNQTSCQNPVIVLKDIDCKNLEYLLDYMYIGEINVRQNELASLVSVAECLKIKGLAVPDDSDTGSNSNPNMLQRSLDEQRPLRKISKSKSNLDQNDSFEDTEESIKEENEDQIIYKKSTMDDALIGQHSNIKSEPNDSPLLLDSEMSNNEENSNFNALNSLVIDSENTINDQYLYKERLVDERMKEISNFPGPSHSQLGIQNIDWDSSQLESMSEAFSSQLLNSDHSELPMLLSSGHSILSAKNIGLKRLKRRFSQLKKTNSSFLNKNSFVCPHCTYSCNDKSNFKRHVQIHTGEKPYHCPFCRYSCIHSSNLKTHIRNKHADDFSDPTQSYGNCFSVKNRLGTTNNVSSLHAATLLSSLETPTL